MTQNILSRLPAVDKLLAQASELINLFGRPDVTSAVREVLAETRQALQQQKVAATSASDILQQVTTRLHSTHKATIQPVINLSGTVLHTNLGRAELPQNAIDAVVKVAMGYSNLEFDIELGQRGDRDAHLEALLLKLTGAEAATVVNNNAAAVLLVLNTLAVAREVPVSRGELVEIGGSFRIPEVMSRANCTLVEIGSTNRTHLKDYANAINPNTALLMKVHTSNYKIQGFTKSVSDEELAQLATENNIPFVTDLGSGSLVDLSRWGLPYEPTVQSMIKKGVDITTFSGDKLLGGPQCGIIVGTKALIGRIKNNPMKRALRVDKMTIAALYEVLKLYLDPDQLPLQLPTLRYLTKSQTEICASANAILPHFQNNLPHHICTIAACASQIGSGSLPTDLLPSFAIKVQPRDKSDKALTHLAAKFRQLPLPVIGRIHNRALMLDLRTLNNQQILINQLSLIEKSPLVKA